MVLLTFNEYNISVQWIRRNGTDYEYHFHTKSADFREAEDFCRQFNSHLTSIENDEENLWLHSHR